MADFYIPSTKRYAASTNDDSSSSSGGSNGGSSKGNFYIPSTKSYAQMAKKRKEEEDARKEELKLQQAKAEQEAKKNGGGNPLKSLTDTIGNVGKSLFDAATSQYKRLGEGGAEVLNEITGQAQRERDANEQRNQQDIAMIRSLGDKIKSAKTDEEKQRYRDALSKITAISTQQDKDFQARQDQIRERVDPVKGAAAVGEVGLDILTAGTLRAGATALKAGLKEGAGTAAETGLKITAKNAGAKALAKESAKQAGVGAGYGTLGTLEDKGSDANAQDIALNTAFGAGLGAVAPVIGKGIKKGAVAAKNAIQDSRANKLALKEGSKATVEKDGLNAVLNQAVDEQSDKYGKNILTRTKELIGDQANPYRALAKIDDQYAKANGIKRSLLPATESVEDMARRSAASEREAAGLFEKKLTTKDANGNVVQGSAKDLVKKYDGDSEAGKEFNNYTNAKFDLEFRDKKNKNGGDFKRIQNGVSREDLQKFVSDYEAKNPDALKDLALKKAVNDESVDYLVRSKAISKEEGETIKGAYKSAVPLERIFPDDLARPEMAGRNVGSIAKQTVIQKLEGGSDIPLSNSFDTMLNRVYKAVSQGNRAQLAQKLLERSEQGHINGSKLLVTAGNKEARKAIREDVAMVNKGIRTLQKKVVLSNRQIRRLERELKGLNIEGMQASIKNAGTDELQRARKTVTVKTIKEQIRDNAPKTIDDLKNSYGMKAQLVKEYGKGEKGIQQMAADIHNGGWNQLMKLNPELPEATAKSLASQILKKPTVKGAVTTVTEGTEKGASTRQLIQNMINAPAADVKRIQAKIATREPKLAAKLDEVLNTKAQIEANRAAKTAMKEVTADFTDDPTTGKQVISGVIDGQSYKLEVPPDLAKAVQGMDQQKLGPVLKAFAIAKKPFEVAWTGIANPIFSGVSFAFYDTPMSVINSPQGFRTLSPKAVVESIRSIRSSDEFQRALSENGARPYGGSGSSSFIKPDAKSLAAQGNILKQLKYNAKNPAVALSNLDVWGGKLANSTRTRVAYSAAADSMRKQGIKKFTIADIANNPQAMADATRAYRTVMPDFDTMSNLTRQINSVVPFYAASVAGTRSLAQAMKRDPIGTSAKALTLGIAPMTGITAFSMMQPAGQEFYADMEKNSPQTLDNNMIVVLPGAKKNKDTGEWSGIIKIPLAPEFRALNQSVWRGVRGATGGEGADASHIALSLFDTVTGGVRTSQNPYVDTLKILSGEDPRTGERIIRGSMADLPKNEQAYDTTSGAGRFIGDVLGTSPIQGDKILGQFGLVGATAKNGGDAAGAIAEGTGSKFVGARGQSASDAFYKSYSPAKASRDKVSREVTSLVKQGRINEAKRRADEFNSTIPGRFADYGADFYNQEGDNTDWHDMLNGLYIKTTENSFKARAKQ